MTLQEKQNLEQLLKNINFLRDSNLKRLDEAIQTPLVNNLCISKGQIQAIEYYTGKLHGLSEAYQYIKRFQLLNSKK